jgi:hypothetical protein
VVHVGASVRNMTLPPDIPAATPEQRLRLVVKARTSGVRAYIWEIIRDDIAEQRSVSQSSRAYRSMEDAYDRGSIALARYKRMSRRP